ncbi:lipoate--protein ligase family protein [Geobacter sp. DSM 9736]|uniref:lipoate--protein ligase family protein n=1 Tax=Geobacter sp. DSM 9736 TaxID=1277350 RepID=UPI001560CAB4|nr:lipoate--protein ligase family protein [Geobacter sp. DSM 9736]
MDRARQTWRLVDTGPLDGAANMAVDEALLACFDPERSEPVLRLYGWAPPALSLGRFQEADEVLDTGKCRAAGIAVVKRITGGGVIYHSAELTYAIVCAPRHIPHSASVKDSFRVLTSFLLRFYRMLGLDPAYAVDLPTAGGRLGARTPFCFAGRESYDILVGGRKIGGNAQRRQRQAIFQHGSIPFLNYAEKGASFMREPPEGIDRGVAALADLGIERDEHELKRLLVDAFAEAMGVELQMDELTAQEKREAFPT